jgi:hypothetical protein
MLVWPDVHFDEKHATPRLDCLYHSSGTKHHNSRTPMDGLPVSQ